MSIMENKNTWIFDNGISNGYFATFPFAYRAMFNLINKSIEAGKVKADVVKKFKIRSPVGTVYSYDKATQLALSTGLLGLDGTLNAREFKKYKPV